MQSVSAVRKTVIIKLSRLNIMPQGLSRTTMRGSVVERRSLTGELSLRLVADG